MVTRTVKLYLCAVAVASAVSVVASVVAVASAGAVVAQSELGTLGHESNSPWCISLPLSLFPAFSLSLQYASLSLSLDPNSGEGNGYRYSLQQYFRCGCEWCVEWVLACVLICEQCAIITMG